MKALWLTIGLALPAAALHAQATDGKAVYEKSCKMCHGADGIPNPAMVKMLATLPTLDPKFLANVSKDSIVKLVTNGSANGKMKGYKDKLTPAQISAVADYVKEITKPKG